MKIIDAGTRAIDNLGNHQFGKCNICGNPTVFVCIDSTAARNNMYCLSCRSSARKRHVAKILLQELFPDVLTIASIAKGSQYRIYNADINDAFAKVFDQNIRYISSSFYPDIPPGTEIHPGVYCQDLESLTFEDESFDVIITEDVFEHVRNHQKGFREVHRVLKQGGYHIFTVPCFFDRETLTRVDTSTPEDIHLLPPEYHGDRIRGKILAYRTFGIDIFAMLDEIGFETRVDFSSYRDRKSGIFDSYVFYSRKVVVSNE
ncbi:MAG: methyltransferase domain-containing protein [Cyanobacteria bacterium P01_A01_bin.45]